MINNTELMLQIWKELKSYIHDQDYDDAAYDFIHVLVEHGVSTEDLLSYSLDSDLKSAIRDFDADAEIDDDEPDEYDDYGYE